jgi:hypothetical protein
MSLIRLMPGGEVQSSTLNDNFDYLEGLISSSVSTLDGKVNSTTGNIANITSNMATIQTNLTNVTNTANSKAKKDLSDASPSATFKANTLGWMAPNRGAGYGVASGWTAPKAGWINSRHHQSGDNQTITLKVDGAVVFETGGGGSYSGGDVDNIEFFINKGSNVTFTGSGDLRVTFYPCKGV